MLYQGHSDEGRRKLHLCQSITRQPREPPPPPQSVKDTRGLNNRDFQPGGDLLPNQPYLPPNNTQQILPESCRLSGELSVRAGGPPCLSPNLSVKGWDESCGLSHPRSLEGSPRLGLESMSAGRVSLGFLFNILLVFERKREGGRDVHIQRKRERSRSRKTLFLRVAFAGVRASVPFLS